MFNILALCVWALITVSTSCALLFTCCNKKKKAAAAPQPKRVVGNRDAKNSLVPSDEAPKSKKAKGVLQEQQEGKKSPIALKPPQQQSNKLNAESGKKAEVDSQLAMKLSLGLGKKKQKPADPPVPAVIVDSSAENLGPEPIGVDVPPTIEPDDDDELEEKTNKSNDNKAPVIPKEDKEQQTDLRSLQIQKLIMNQKKELAKKPTVDAAQQTSLKTKEQSVKQQQHQRHHGRHGRLEVVVMAEKGQQTSDRLRIKSPLPSAGDKERTVPARVAAPAEEKLSSRAKEQEAETVPEEDASRKSAKEDSKSSEEKSSEESDEDDEEEEKRRQQRKKRQRRR